jgi:hypothetical protein
VSSNYDLHLEVLLLEEAYYHISHMQFSLLITGHFFSKEFSFARKSPQLTLVLENFSQTHKFLEECFSTNILKAYFIMEWVCELAVDNWIFEFDD